MALPSQHQPALRLPQKLPHHFPGPTNSVEHSQVFAVTEQRQHVALRIHDLAAAAGQCLEHPHIGHRSVGIGVAAQPVRDVQHHLGAAVELGRSLGLTESPLKKKLSPPMKVE